MVNLYVHAASVDRSTGDNDGSFVDKLSGRRHAHRVERNGFTLPVHYLRQLAEELRGRGGDVAQWLAESGLSEEALAAPTLAVDYDVFEHLVTSLLAVTREPALGLFVGERVLPTQHGMLGYAALSSGTVRQALALFEQYVRIRTSLVSVSLVSKGEREIEVHFDEPRPLGTIRRPVLEATLLSIKNVLGAISMGGCRVQAVVFPFATPDYAAIARDLFGCEVRYGGSWAGFVLPTADLDTPLKNGDPEAFEEAARICQRELDKLTADESLAARVRRLLLEKQGGFPTLPVVARLLHLTPRTLHRRLEDEGTSYREILEETRHALAIEQVRSGRFGLEEIAYRLGYSDLANFRRAFKRWEAMPPSAYGRKRE